MTPEQLREELRKRAGVLSGVPTDEQLRRMTPEQLRAALEAEEASLTEDNDKLQAKAEELKETVRKLRSQRKELVGKVKGLAAQAKSAGKG